MLLICWCDKIIYFHFTEQKKKGKSVSAKDEDEDSLPAEAIDAATKVQGMSLQCSEVLSDVTANSAAM